MGCEDDTHMHEQVAMRAWSKVMTSGSAPKDPADWAKVIREATKELADFHEKVMKSVTTQLRLQASHMEVGRAREMYEGASVTLRHAQLEHSLLDGLNTGEIQKDVFDNIYKRLNKIG